MYKLFETDEFTKSLARLDKKDSSFIGAKLNSYVYPQLRVEPHFGKNIKRLQKYPTPTWRYRIGNYRVFYTIDEVNQLVLLLVVDHRKRAYR